MTKAHWWQRKSGRIVAEFDLFCGCVIVAIMALPAVAETTIPVPFTSTVINIGDIPPWIMAGVVLVTWWEARRAKKSSMANAENIGKVQANVALIERNTNSLTKQLEANALQTGERIGADKQKIVAADAADQLAKGQREGREIERASVAAQGTANGVAPVAIEDTPATIEKPKEQP